ncbi:MAG: hypothetical protein EBW87_00135 [Burkholderiaceae bacterium]|nr:hypothetical protein [Burkholderiaceae bacterium]
MARKLQDQVNVVAPSADYPFGRIKNDTGSRDGTPVNEELYGDIHQFFAKLLNEAGLTANGLPDNTTNGFQLFNALVTWLTSKVSSGFYTPTITNSFNVSSITSIGEFRWNRVGDVVTISGTFSLSITNTAIESGVLVSIPVASNFSTTSQASGSGHYHKTEYGVAVRVIASPSDDKLQLTFKEGETFPRELSFIAQYKVVI